MEKADATWKAIDVQAKLEALPVHVELSLNEKKVQNKRGRLRQS